MGINEMMSNISNNCSGPDSEGMKLFLGIAYIPVAVVGLLVNGSAVFVFLCKKAAWNDTHVYTLSLASANCALVLFLPFRIYDAFRPMKLSAFCTFLVSTHYINMYASIFTRTAISIHRCVLLKFPIQRRTRDSQKTIAFAVCILIWVTVVTICATFIEENLPAHMKMCYKRSDEPLSGTFILLLEILGFLLPLFIITLCSMQTIFVLMKNETAKIKMVFVRIITANLIVFVICYSPIHVGLFLRFNAGKFVNCKQYNLISSYYQICEWIATTNCCWDFVAFYCLLKTLYRID
ncbi:lysophosphatidic acid receptor 6-like isoform X1 [Paramormyrops kingsleyae]|uniref:Lysophosphatidic acid receptor 6-like n=2 Tax=Paramormyrops kingsleyae TaxID=1676925 RepID=A0A3B3S140_9TELE|nr:lysophosphatidic acid receptor 6-like isoform X1 [Paramormyrops kingsleyae]